MEVVVNFPLTVSVKSSRPEVFCKKVVLRNFAKFTGKHRCRNPFFNKGPRSATFLTKDTPIQLRSCEFCEIFKNTVRCY